MAPQPSDHTRISRALESLFDPRVATSVATAEMYGGRLLPEEMAGTQRMVPERLAEFTAGRLAARGALRSLGIDPRPIVRDESRAPVWPEGIVGSISHCAGLCVAAVARSTDVMGLGLDVEPAEPLARELVPSVCSAGELNDLGKLSRPPAADWPRIVFSAKESYYKAWFPIVGRPLDFSDVTIRINHRRSTFTIDHRDDYAGPLPPWGRSAGGRFALEGGYLVTGLTIPPVNRPA